MGAVQIQVAFGALEGIAAICVYCDLELSRTVGDIQRSIGCFGIQGDQFVLRIAAAAGVSIALAAHNFAAGGVVKDHRIPIGRQVYQSGRIPLRLRRGLHRLAIQLVESYRLLTSISGRFIVTEAHLVASCIKAHMWTRCKRDIYAFFRNRECNRILRRSILICRSCHPIGIACLVDILSVRSTNDISIRNRFNSNRRRAVCNDSIFNNLSRLIIVSSIQFI